MSIVLPRARSAAPQSPRVSPICPAHVLARSRPRGRAIRRVVKVVDHIGLPGIVAFGREARLCIQPVEGAKQGPVAPLEGRVASALQNDGLRERSLERL